MKKWECAEPVGVVTTVFGGRSVNMKTNGLGGLQGKERRMRDRGRAERMYLQSLIDEYLHPDEKSGRRERFVPIRSRSDFLPSAAFAEGEQNQESMRQLELSFEVALASAPTQQERMETKSVKSPALVLVQDEPAGKSFKPVLVKRPSRAADPRVASPTPVSEREFTLRGLLFGSAMGSAAAAMLLLVVRLLF